MPVNGVCGSANGASFYSSVPATYLCNAGLPSAVGGSGPWTWTCSGLYGGLNSSQCSANRLTSPPPGCTSSSGYSTTTGMLCSEVTPVTPPVMPVVPVMPAGGGSSCALYMTGYMSLGATDNNPSEVKKLQTFLRDYEGFSGLQVTGVYDLATFNDVEQFQAKYATAILAPWGFTAPTGIVNRTTVAEINLIYCGITRPVTVVTPPAATTTCAAYLTKYMSLGAADNDPAEVEKLQTFLHDYEGFTSLPSTGYFGPLTYAAVKQFQTKYADAILAPWGFTAPTGIVNRTTVAEINAIYCKTAKPVVPACTPYLTDYMSQGADNDVAEVEKLQIFLRDYEGFSDLPVNGNFGPQTFADVEQFQTKYADSILVPWGFTAPTGLVNRTTVAKINSIYCGLGQ